MCVCLLKVEYIRWDYCIKENIWLCNSSIDLLYTYVYAVYYT